MNNQIDVFLATPIVKIILDKLHEDAGSKLSKKVVELASAPIQKLGQLVWNRCFSRSLGADKLLEAAAKGSEPELKQIQDCLLKEMENPDFLGIVLPIAQEIHRVIVQTDMDREIEILFRVPYRILQQVEIDAGEKKRFGTAFQYTDAELLDRIEKADSALAQAEDNFKIQIQKSEVSLDHRRQFMHAKAEYSIKSEELKDAILSRLNPIFSILCSA